MVGCPSPFKTPLRDKEQGFPSSQVRDYLPITRTWDWNGVGMHSEPNVRVGDYAEISQHFKGKKEVRP